MQHKSFPCRVFRNSKEMEFHCGTWSTTAGGLVSDAQVHPGTVGPVENIV